jgi:hypothetical protein
LTDDIFPPFSARHRGSQAQIDNDFPETARIGLLHLVYGLVQKKYVEDWNAVKRELQRIARIPPGGAADEDGILLSMPWQKVADFCERLYSFLSTDEYRYNQQASEFELITPRSDVQEYIAGELQRLFLEENLAFEFSNGLVRRRGRRHTAEQVSRGEMVLGDPKLSKAREHFTKALRYFRNVFLFCLATWATGFLSLGGTYERGNHYQGHNND